MFTGPGYRLKCNINVKIEKKSETISESVEGVCKFHQIKLKNFLFPVGYNAGPFLYMKLT